MVDLLAAVSLSGYRYLGDATVAPIGMKFCTMVHIGPIGGGILKDKKTEFFGNFGLSDSRLTVNISKTLSRRVTCRLELNISSTRAF